MGVVILGCWRRWWWWRWHSERSGGWDIWFAWGALKGGEGKHVNGAISDKWKPSQHTISRVCKNWMENKWKRLKLLPFEYLRDEIKLFKFKELKSNFPQFSGTKSNNLPSIILYIPFFGFLNYFTFLLHWPS